MKENIKNPLLDTYQTPFNTPPFDQIENHHYIPAFDEGIKLLNEEILHIVNNKEYIGTINSDASFIRYHCGDTIDVLHSKLIPTLSVTQEVANKYQTLSPSLLISPILVIVIFNIFMFMI